MKEPYDQGLANQIGPAPCAEVREGIGEASERGSVSWVSSRESNLRDADPVGKWGRQHGTGRDGEPCGRSCVVIGPRHVWTLLAREPGDLSLGRLASCRRSASGRPKRS